MSPWRLPCFKRDVIRGRLRDQFNEDLAFRVGLACARQFRPERVVVGRDVRHSGPVLLNALANGLALHGVKVLNLGICATEEVWWAAQQAGIDAGIMVTGGHEAAHHNGFKLVRRGAAPLTQAEYRALEQLTARSEIPAPARRAPMIAADFRDGHVAFLRRYLPQSPVRRLAIVVNPGNGSGAPLLDALEPVLPYRLIKMHYAPDGGFPNGLPAPLLPRQRARTGTMIRAQGADLGVAWDADLGRCFLFDEQGRSVNSYYLIGLLAQVMLNGTPGARIVHDQRLVWNTQEQIDSACGVAVPSAAGASSMRATLLREDAIYGGECNAHHYFADFGGCDSGMLPWLLVARLVATSGLPLSQWIEQRARLYPNSGDIARAVKDPVATLDLLATVYGNGRIDRGDGLSVEFADWRFNVRIGDGDGLLHLNVEARGDAQKMRAMTREVLRRIDSQRG